MLPVGSEVGGYRIEGILGRGGMGVVYEATQLSLVRTVALKVLAQDLSENEAFRTRFRREGRMQAGLDHDNIVTVFEAGEIDEGLFIAMRLIRGPNLKELIHAGALGPDRTVRILVRVADALDTAHEAGLVHRDIKPHNILVDRRDQGYLADFGLTRASADAGLTQTGRFVGTPDYIAPEQVAGEAPSPASDLYAFGAVAYECLTGSVPFRRPTTPAVLFAHMSEPPPRVTTMRPDLPPAVDDVITRAMAKDAGVRQASAVELMDDLRGALGASAAARTAPAAPPPRPPPPSPSPSPPDGGTVPNDATEIRSRPGLPTHADRRRPWTQLRRPAAPVSEVTPLPPAPVTEPVVADRGAEDAEPASGLRDETEVAPSRRAPAPVLAGAAIAVVGLAVALGLAVGGGHDPGAAAAAARVTAGPATVRGPAGWNADEAAPVVGGLPLARARSLVAAAGGTGGRLTVGLTDAQGPMLLPATFVGRLARPPAADDRVRLGGAEALRFAGIRPGGSSQPLTLFVAPTDSGVVTIVCQAPGAAALDRCERAAGTLKLAAGTTVHGVGPDTAYARRLTSVLARLDGERDQAVARLRQAKTTGRQEQAADDLRRAYRLAATRVGAIVAGPRERPAHRALQLALERSAAAYRELAQAAHARRRAAYNAARQAVEARQRALRASLLALQRAGYRRA